MIKNILPIGKGSAEGFLMTPEKNIYVKGEECRKCVWSNTESGKILCTKSCRKKGGKI